MKNSMLDYQMYLIPLPNGVDVGHIPKVLRTAFDDTTVTLNVEYYASLETQWYVSSQQKHASKSLLHDPNLKKENQLFGSENYVKIANQEDQVHLLADSNQCINAVLEVNYIISWSANEIAKIDVHILLGNLTLNKASSGDETPMSQKTSEVIEPENQ